MLTAPALVGPSSDPELTADCKRRRVLAVSEALGLIALPLSPRTRALHSFFFSLRLRALHLLLARLVAYARRFTARDIFIRSRRATGPGILKNILQFVQEIGKVCGGSGLGFGPLSGSSCACPARPT